MITTVVFLKGCNFHCPFCHNPELVLTPNTIPDFPVSELFSFLDQKKDWVDLVLFSGGEPTLYPQLPLCLKELKDQGFKTGIHTNGTNPEVLEQALREKVLDYLVMDIKSRKEKYPKAAGKPDASWEKLAQSIALVKSAKISLGAGFKLTLVPGLVEKEDLKEIRKIVAGADFLDLQQFRPLRCLDKNLENRTPYSKEVLEEMALILEGATKRTTRMF